MNNTATIEFEVGTTDAGANLGIEIWLDNNCVYKNNHVIAPHKFAHSLVDDDAEHELRIVMSGKTLENTTVDEQGNIVKDALLTISNPAIDGIDVAQLFIDQTVYTHNFNGSQDKIDDKFYGNMGCNGTVSLKFSTPIYLWLLENM